MAKLKLYSVLDVPVGAYSAPHCALTRGQAVRDFIDHSSKPDNSISRHPEDYVLHEIGDFDESTGFITAYMIPEKLGSAASYLSKSKEN